MSLRCQILPFPIGILCLDEIASVGVTILAKSHPMMSSFSLEGSVAISVQ